MKDRIVGDPGVFEDEGMENLEVQGKSFANACNWNVVMLFSVTKDSLIDDLRKIRHLFALDRA